MGTEVEIERALMADGLAAEIGSTGHTWRALYKAGKIPGELVGKRVYFNAQEVLTAVRLQEIAIRGWSPPEAAKESTALERKIEAIEAMALKKAQRAMIAEIEEELSLAENDMDYPLMAALHRKVADMLEEAHAPQGVVQSQDDGEAG